MTKVSRVEKKSVYWYHMKICLYILLLMNNMFTAKFKSNMSNNSKGIAKLSPSSSSSWAELALISQRKFSCTHFCSVTFKHLPRPLITFELFCFLTKNAPSGPWGGVPKLFLVNISGVLWVWTPVKFQNSKKNSF